MAADVLGLDGLRTLLALEGTVDGHVFLTWTREALVPVLNQGDIVVLDNHSIHKVEGVKEAIEAAGATVLFLPPYSPEFSPIEPWWSKFKGLLRKAQARTTDALMRAMKAAVEAITLSDIEAWFIHCGWTGQHA